MNARIYFRETMIPHRKGETKDGQITEDVGYPFHVKMFCNAIKSAMLNESLEYVDFDEITHGITVEFPLWTYQTEAFHDDILMDLWDTLIKDKMDEALHTLPSYLKQHYLVEIEVLDENDDYFTHSRFDSINEVDIPLMFIDAYSETK